MKQAFIALSLLILSSCYATVGSKRAVASGSPNTCNNFCRDMGLDLSAVVVMADNVGCVCNVRTAAPSPTANAVAAAQAGMATIVQQQQEEEETRQRTQQATRH